MKFLCLLALLVCLQACQSGGSNSSQPRIQYLIHQGSNQVELTLDGTNISAVQWDLADGHRKQGREISHHYYSPGNYQITCSYKRGDQKFEQYLNLSLEGDFTQLLVSPQENVIIDSDHNDPSQYFRRNDKQAQFLPSPFRLSGILMEYCEHCTSGDSSSTSTASDLKDTFKIIKPLGHDVHLNVFKGSVNVAIYDESKSLLNAYPNISGQWTLPNLSKADQHGNHPLFISLELHPLHSTAQYSLHTNHQLEPKIYSEQDIEALNKAIQPGKLIIKWKDKTSPELVDIQDSRLYVNKLTPSFRNGTQKTQAPKFTSAIEARKILMRKNIKTEANIESVDFNYIRKAQTDDAVLDSTVLDSAVLDSMSTSFNWLWPWQSLNVEPLWDFYKQQGITPAANSHIAIIDSGINFEHPSFLNLNHHSGYDFISDPINSNDGDGWDENPTEPQNHLSHNSVFHGSHVTGLIAAQPMEAHPTFNGIAWGSQIIPLRVLGLNGGSSYDIIQAMRYAAGLDNDTGKKPIHKAHIINLSLGGQFFSDIEQATIQEIINSGTIVVAASGNEGSSTLHYPAGYQGVISVGSYNHNLQTSPYTNHNPTLDLLAPGGECNNQICESGILSIDGAQSAEFESDLRFLSGTSMSAALVSGLLAVLKSEYPSLDTEDILQLIDDQTISNDLNQVQTLDGNKLVDLIAGNNDISNNTVSSTFLHNTQLWTSRYLFELSEPISSNELDTQIYVQPVFASASVRLSDISIETASTNVDGHVVQNSQGDLTVHLEVKSTIKHPQKIDIYLDHNGEKQNQFDLWFYPKSNLANLQHHLYVNDPSSNMDGLRSYWQHQQWRSFLPADMSPLVNSGIMFSSDLDYDGVYCELGEICAQWAEHNYVERSESTMNHDVIRIESRLLLP